MTEFSKFHQETAKREYDRALRDLRELKKKLLQKAMVIGVVQIEDAIDQQTRKTPRSKKLKRAAKSRPVFHSMA